MLKICHTQRGHRWIYYGTCALGDG